MTDPTLDPDVLARWIGRTEERRDVIDARHAERLAATLDAPVPGPGAALPPLWHWAWFTEARPETELGRDGHPKRGGFLPPVALPRRMWAGGRLDFKAPLLVGATLTRHSTIADVQVKQGRTGALAFVTVRHDLADDTGAPCLSEEHDIVYREDPAPGAPVRHPPEPPEGPARERQVAASAVTLFRYSALTFNGHRIHYDRPYAQEVEGYPDLVVHGPLIATLLAAHAGQDAPPGRALRHFAFRAQSPICGSAPFTLCGRPLQDEQGAQSLWALSSEGQLAMTAQAHFG